MGGALHLQSPVWDSCGAHLRTDAQRGHSISNWNPPAESNDTCQARQRSHSDSALLSWKKTAIIIIIGNHVVHQSFICIEADPKLKFLPVDQDICLCSVKGRVYSDGQRMTNWTSWREWLKHWTRACRKKVWKDAFECERTQPAGSSDM